MRRRRKPLVAEHLFTAATLGYTANCALGASVATGLVDTRNFRWVHHALYIVTCIATATAVTGGLAAGARTPALLLAPAAVPLAALTRSGTRGRRHPLVALTAAPFFAAALIAAHAPRTHRKRS